MFSNNVRATIDSMPNGTELTMKELANMLGVTSDAYRSKSKVLNAIFLEKLHAGSLERLEHGLYRKVKTVVTTKQLASNPTAKKRKHRDSQEMVVHKGIIYESISEFLEYHPVTFQRLKNRCDYGYFDGYAIFLTKNRSNAEYYAKNFANTVHVKINENDPDEEW